MSRTTEPAAEERFAPWTSGLLVPDEVLLRRFGLVRAVGGGTYIIAVVVLFAIYGIEVWPLLIGVPVLAVVTTAFFMRSSRAPRLSVVMSLVADAVVLGGAISYIGGTGSGLVMLYTIVIVSGGILLGPVAATWAAISTGALSLLQLGFEELGLTPVLLHRPALTDRIPILLIALFGIASIGYLTATYASRLHELIAEAGAEAEVVARRGRRRRSFVEKATSGVQEPLRELEVVAEVLEDGWPELGDGERVRLASRLRMGVMRLDGEIARLADVGSLDAASDTRPEPVLLSRVVQDCLVALGERLAEHAIQIDVPPIKVAGNRRAARRVVYDLLENIVKHTPAGTRARVTARASAGNGVIVVSDDGPGIPDQVVAHLFDPSGGDGTARVGLPLVAELCEAMGAKVRHETPPEGGSRFLVAFRLAPSGAPTADDDAIRPG